MRRALVVVCVFFIFQQITGINVPLYYGPHLLGPTSQAGTSLVATTVAGVEVTAIMTAVNVASTYLGFRWIDKFGRRKLSMGGYTGMIVFALIAAAGLAFASGTFRLVVIMIGLDGFIASFAVGVGGTGWTLQGEVFPTAVRGQAAAFAAMIDWLANFLVIELFPVSQNAISLGGVLVVFAGLCALAIVFIWKFLPETKGLPVEDIIQLFDEQAKQGPLGEAAPLPTRSPATNAAQHPRGARQADGRPSPCDGSAADGDGQPGLAGVRPAQLSGGVHHLVAAGRVRRRRHRERGRWGLPRPHHAEHRRARRGRAVQPCGSCRRDPHAAQRLVPGRGQRRFDRGGFPAVTVAGALTEPGGRPAWRCHEPAVQRQVASAAESPTYTR